MHAGEKSRDNRFAGTSVVVGWTLLWAICSLCSLAVLARPRTATIDVDELYWVGSAYYYHLVFRVHDTHHADWQLLPARENPPVAKYAIGLGLACADQQVASIDTLARFYAFYENRPGAWGTGTDREKRAAVVARLTPDVRAQLRTPTNVSLASSLLLPARVVMIVCSVLASGLVVMAGAMVSGNRAGLLASQLLLIHPSVVYAYNHAMSDAVALLFSTATGVAGLWFARRGSVVARVGTKTTWACSCAIGILLGLACGAKMNSVVVAIFLLACVALPVGRALRRGDLQRATQTLGHAAAFLGVALLVFVAINPTIQHDLIGGLIATVREHRLTEAIQARFLSNHLTTIGARFAAVATLTFFNPACCMLVMALAVGCLFVKSDAIRLLGCWWAIAFVCVVIWIPFPWLRYVVPLIVPSVLVVAVAVMAIFDVARTSLYGRAFPGANT